jgi:hypothetical protein
MEDKIYEKLKEQEKESSNHYLNVMGISADSPITGTIPKKNLDLMTILNKTGLIEKNPENCKKINEFHDYLFKFAIGLGIGHAKSMIIKAIQKGQLDFELLMDVNPEEYVNYDLEPTYIRDMKEAILNEK